MKNFISLVFFARASCFSLFLLLVAACGSAQSEARMEDWQKWRSNNGKVKVLVTIAMIADLVHVIGDGYVDTLTLIKGDLDPHSYQLVKGDDEKLRLADVIFFNGLGLEHGPSLQHYLYDSSKSVSLGDKIKEKTPSKILSFKGQVDPHIWMDVELWSDTIPFIVAALSSLDPSHAHEFKKNGDDLQEMLLEAHLSIRSMMLKIPEDHRYLVTSHDAFNYFTRAYLATDQEVIDGTWSDRFVAPEGLAPESQLSVIDIQQTIDHLSKYRVHVVFPESNVSKDSIRKIVQASKEKRLNVNIANAFLYADAMGRPGSDGDTYIKMIEHNAKTIAQFLSQEKNHP